MINILFGFDDKFAKYAATAMASILSNHKLNGSNKICFFLPDIISPVNKERLLDLKKMQDFECLFYKVDKTAFEGLPINCWSVATYFKLLIPELFNVDKILALDSDIIVRKDIQSLWDTDISDYLAAAVRIGDGADRDDYFNAGVVAFNVKALKEFDFRRKWRDFIKVTPAKSLVCVDQDILNPILEGKVYFLPMEYNVIGSYYDYMLKNHTTDKIVIQHYTPGKPLGLDCPPFLRKLWFNYLSQTAWKQSWLIFMCHFWIKLFLLNPIFFLKPKYWRKFKEIRRQSKSGER